MDSFIPAYKISNYFISKAIEEGKKLSVLQLLKLVYISHGWYLGFYDKPLIKEQVQAWKYGPVIKELYTLLKYYSSPNNIYTPVFENNPIPNNEQVIGLLSRVWDVYKDRTPKELSTITHYINTPWYNTWFNNGGKDSNDVPISNNSIKEYYLDKINNINR